MPLTKEERLRAALTPHTVGAQWRYAKGCRCDACRKAWAEYRRDRNRAYYARKKEHEPTA